VLDLAWIRENPDVVRRGAAAKRIVFDVDELLRLDAERRRVLKAQEESRAEQNALGRQVKSLSGDAKAQTLARLGALKQKVQELTDALRPLQERLDRMLLECPNPPDPEAPDGADDRSNVEVRRHGEPTAFDFEPKDHVEIATALRLVDIERAGKLGGSRSYVLQGDGMLLEQAVLRLALDLIVKRGFVPLSVPVIVKDWALRGTAYFPGAEEQTYQVANPTSEDATMWLVGTSEVSVTAFRAGEILDLA
jgi:seryl-tRNA synthetase